jgi:hypothetical protein
MTAATLVRPVSPCCRKPLEGGPVIFWCTGCRHDVHGSTVSREVPARPADCSAFHGAFGPGCPWCSPRDRGAGQPVRSATTTQEASTRHA